MNYYDIVTEDSCDLNALSRYVIRGSAAEGIAMIAFQEKDLGDIREKFAPENLAQFYREDRALCRLTESGMEEFGRASRPLKVWYRREHRRFARKRKLKLRLKSCTQTEIRPQKIPAVRYKAYEYIDRENGMIFPYRFRRAPGGKKQPLVVYFHGASAMGEDNILQYLEYLPMAHYLHGQNCNILLPQCPYGLNRNDEFPRMVRYIDAVDALIRRLAEREPVDLDRVYLIGTSLGGSMVWEMAYRHPQLIAAGLAVMGIFMDYALYQNAVELEQNSSSRLPHFSRMRDVPLWIAHAADDTNVSIAGDDGCVEQLQRLGAAVRYSRYDRYGHRMHTRFYRKEPWVDWLFRQSLNR
ncbi:MAG TPA: alpha/beta fold hydrolase [Candidatus Onthovicinus excrementipullorum]|nr:alpha/beta fold hydrolase [Candidatus Onthovicinus excrementipullorum]